MEKHLRARRAIAVATAAVIGAAMPAQSSEIQRAYQQHTATCIGLFFSDRKAHAAQCLPNNMVVEWTSTSSGGAPPAPVTPTTAAARCGGGAASATRMRIPAPKCGPACEQLV